MEKDLTLVVLAAGMGSRFGGLKQIEPVGPHGEFILDYNIYDAIFSGFNKIVFVINEDNYEIFKSTIGSRIASKVKVEYAFQKLSDIPAKVPEGRKKPWGTAHAIYAARDYVDDNFGVINADDFYGRDAFVLLAQFFKDKKKIDNKNEYAIITYKLCNTMTTNGAVKRGVCKETDNGLLDDITECLVDRNNESKIIIKPLESNVSYEAEENTPVSMSLIGVDKTFMDFIKNDIKNFTSNIKDPLTSEYGLPTVLLKTTKENYSTVFMLKTKSKWYGLTYKDDMEELKEGIKKLIDNGDYKEDLWG